MRPEKEQSLCNVDGNRDSLRKEMKNRSIEINRIESIITILFQIEIHAASCLEKETRVFEDSY